MSRTNKDLDEALLPFLNEPNQDQSDRLLEQICNSSRPIIEDIVNFKMRVHPLHGSPDEQEDSADACSEITLKLISRLRQIKSAGDSSKITNLRGYVATIAYNACDEYLRRKYPRRHSLKNKLRYVLTHQRGLNLWESSDGKWVAGFEEWRRSTVHTTIARIEPVKEPLIIFLKETFNDSGRRCPGDLLASTFDWIGGVVELDDLVGLVAEIWEVQDQRQRPDDWSVSKLSFDPSAGMEAAIDHRTSAKRMWIEICQLPLRQRAALLLSARDAQGTSVAQLLPPAAIATFREIADALEISNDELTSLWDELPLEDSVIASQMGLTRQQVINLRKSARERLARRMYSSKTKGLNVKE